MACHSILFCFFPLCSDPRTFCPSLSKFLLHFWGIRNQLQRSAGEDSNVSLPGLEVIIEVIAVNQMSKNNSNRRHWFVPWSLALVLKPRIPCHFPRDVSGKLGRHD